MVRQEAPTVHLQSLLLSRIHEIILFDCLKILFNYETNCFVVSHIDVFVSTGFTIILKAEFLAITSPNKQTQGVFILLLLNGCWTSEHLIFNAQQSEVQNRSSWASRRHLFPSHQNLLFLGKVGRWWHSPLGEEIIYSSSIKFEDRYAILHVWRNLENLVFTFSSLHKLLC